MQVLEILIGWIHLLCAVLFLGTMFVGTFVLMPVLKGNLDHANRHKFVVSFIPRARAVMRVVIATLVLTGAGQLVFLSYKYSGAAGAWAFGLVSFHILFAAVPVTIFALAPRILGVKSKAGLCCDPDADDPPIFGGVFSSTSSALHYTAISSGWIAVLCAVILTRRF